MGWEDIAIKGGEMLYNQLTSAQQFGRTKKLMDIQQSNQMALNQQGQALQLDTWEKTNYPAQVAMLKQAGLNPSLMYAKGGVGGTTGSQGGGSASMGQAQEARGMDINNLLAYSQAQANIKSTQADAYLKNTQADKLAGVDTTKTQTEIEKLRAETTNEKLKSGLIQVEIALTEANTDKVVQEFKNLQQQNLLIGEQFDSLVKEAKQKAIGAELENTLTKAKIKLTDTERQSIITGITQKWTELGLEGRRVDQKDLEIAIDTFKAEFDAKYPGMGQVIGSELKRIFKAIQKFDELTSKNYVEINEDKINK